MLCLSSWYITFTLCLKRSKHTYHTFWSFIHLHDVPKVNYMYQSKLKCQLSVNHTISLQLKFHTSVSVSYFTFWPWLKWIFALQGFLLLPVWYFSNFLHIFLLFKFVYVWTFLFFLETCSFILQDLKSVGIFRKRTCLTHFKSNSVEFESDYKTIFYSWSWTAN